LFKTLQQVVQLASGHHNSDTMFLCSRTYYWIRVA